MSSRVRLTPLLLLFGLGCRSSAPPAPQEAVPRAAGEASDADAAARAPAANAMPARAQLVAKALPLPGASGAASLDYIVYEPRGRVWVPVGSTGSVDVLDVAARTFTRIDGFKTAEREARGAKRTVGPSAATVGDGVVYIGNRATSEICAVDSSTLQLGTCLKLPRGIDGVAYVASTKEVWVTSPQEQLLAVLDASKPAQLTPKTTIKLDGQPEGYGVDEARGLFFTNLEDKGGTVVIDVKTHKPTVTWNASCGADGPRGLAIDPARGFVVVACTDHVQVLDGNHGGAKLGTLDTGGGVDNIDYGSDTKLLYVAAGKAQRLTVASLDDKGQLAVVATGATAPGARNPVADKSGAVYVADSQAGRLLVFDAPPAHP